MDKLTIEELEDALEQKRKIEKKIRKKKIKRKWRFSEIVILSILIFSIAVFCIAIAFSFINQSDSLWAYLIPTIGGLASSAFAVFVWKEKNENLPKIIANPNYDEEQLIEQIHYEVEEEYKSLGRD